MFFTIPIATRLEATRLSGLRFALTGVGATSARTDLFLVVDDAYRASHPRLLHLSRLGVVAPDGVCHGHAHLVPVSGPLGVFI